MFKWKWSKHYINFDMWKKSWFCEYNYVQSQATMLTNTNPKKSTHFKRCCKWWCASGDIEQVIFKINLFIKLMISFFMMTWSVQWNQCISKTKVQKAIKFTSKTWSSHWLLSIITYNNKVCLFLFFYWHKLKNSIAKVTKYNQPGWANAEIKKWCSSTVYASNWQLSHSES